MSVNVVSRPYYDSFTFNLFNELTSHIEDSESYYIWSDPPWELQNFLSNTVFTKPIVIIGIKDLLDMWGDFNFWQDKKISGVKFIESMANKHRDKKFIIFTSHENLQLEVTATNVYIIPWGGDLVNQANVYPTLQPVLNKNFESDKTFISLNRNPRNHRLVLLSYLFGSGYDALGTITYLGQDIPRDTPTPDNILDCIPWEFEPRHDDIRTKILNGYTKFYNNKTLALDNYKIYKDKANNNFNNFNDSLRSKYENSFVEIVTESSFSAPSYMLTEKTLNAFYACNFPIVLSGCGAVEHLRQLGFDLYDDIIDHTYDAIKNPFDRITTAIETNRQLLVDIEYTKTLWTTNKNRFIKNVEVAKSIYGWYQDRTIQMLNQTVEKLKVSKI